MASTEGDSATSEDCRRGGPTGSPSGSFFGFGFDILLRDYTGIGHTLEGFVELEGHRLTPGLGRVEGHHELVIEGIAPEQVVGSELLTS